ncbi:hypothetical protein BZARG_03540 [Bizionia argentinensis JUB59]|uniref:Uncharacterized protein n=1 Tax=Bizionia argentinensis JUB59 TaxID=1046627 RepID=A0A4U8UJ67_9FLAO|nr:hypothetical protein [Bizionia argentinensis]TLG99010.1 hypothetical protein BZARG_03540 [Bizionia argentinensis JUB59]
MADLIIKYQKKRQYINLFIGCLWIALGAYGLWSSDGIRWSRIIIIAVGTIQVGMVIWNLKYQYLTMTENFIKENFLFGKKILMQDIIHVKKIKGNYAINTADKELVIKTNLIAEDSLIELLFFMGTLETQEVKTI